MSAESDLQRMKMLIPVVALLLTTQPVYISDPSNTTKVTVTTIAAKKALDVNVANTASVPIRDVAAVTAGAVNRNIAGISGPTTDYTCPASKWCTVTVFIVNGTTATTAGSTLLMKAQGNGFKGLTVPVLARDTVLFEVQQLYLPASGTLADQVTVGGGTGTVVISWYSIER